jgi:hypothetical protein
MVNNINEPGLIVVHRKVAVTHEDSVNCCCDPYIFEDDTLKTTTQICEETSKMDIKQ